MGRHSSTRDSVISGGAGTHYDRNSSRAGEFIIPPKHLAFWYNIKSIFAYKPQSQEYLYKQLFEDSERKSMRGSLIFNHM